jgi:BON domain-containing protein
MCLRQRILTATLITAACFLACSSPGAYDRRVSVPLNDTAIDRQIETEIAARGLSGVTVETSSGRVNLSGYVETDEQRKIAETIALRTSGVVEVRNNIVVKTASSVNVNKPGGPRRAAEKSSPNINKPGGPRRHLPE